MKGKIKDWNHDKGFGFIIAQTNKQTIFVHISAFNDRKNKPKIGQTVHFIGSKDKKGRTCAIKVSRRNDKKDWNGFFICIIQRLSWICLAIMLFFIKNSNFVLYIYAGISFITFLVYASDKSAAKKGRWRTSENTLHFLSLIGGWPGALLAQNILRHKSKKLAFQIVFCFTFSLNISALATGFFYLDRAYLMTLASSIEPLFRMF